MVPCSRTLWFILTLFVSLRVGYCDAAETEHIVDLGYVSYLGAQTAPGVVTYYGIPYAEPPLGDLRFRATQTLNTSRISTASGGDVINATTPPNFCVQGTTGGGDAGGAGSEDCLKVNIYTPERAKEGDNLPVLVYIHGGGFVYGNPINWPFTPWVAQSPNLIIVSVYYRLDSLGFLSHPSMPSSDLNAGLQDQLQALNWIHKYIGKFGGNNGQVTISGQSAGAASVEFLLVMDEERTNGLYNAAIIQSVARRPLPLPEQQVALFDYYASLVGCTEPSFNATFACLQNASVSAIARAQDGSEYNFPGPYIYFHPVVDGNIIRDYPTKLITENKFRRVPILIGSTSNETLSGFTNNTISHALSVFFPSLSNSSIEKIEAHYPSSLYNGPNAALWQFGDATGDSELRCARDIIAAAMVNQGQKVYTYRYNQPVPTSGSDVVAHALKSHWMMFNGTSTGPNGTTTFQPQSPTDVAFAQELIAYWISFSRTLGDPNAYKLNRSVVWPEHTINLRQRAVLQEPPNGSTVASGVYIERVPDIELDRCKLLTEHTLLEQEQV